MGLGIIPIETLITSVYGIAVALDDPAGEVEVFPDGQSDVVVELDGANNFSKGRATPDDYKGRTPD